MRKKQLIAMLLAGGQGSRLGVLTTEVAKPALPFGGKYRIIDFTLSNCVHSGIDTVGVLTQYQPLELNTYIGNGQPWDLNRNAGGVYVLPPYIKEGEKGEWYSGTANAIYQNTLFIEQFDPKYILVLSGDHIYKMNYSLMLKEHIHNGADATIAVISVPLEEASRFGIMNTDESGRITEFEEKPAQPKSTNASMGVYIFTWPVLKRYLAADMENPDSHNDFGRDIIPAMLKAGQRMHAYLYSGYWKDVGTVESLWAANMELLDDPAVFEIRDPGWRIYSRNPIQPPHMVGERATILSSLVTEGCSVEGNVSHSVLFAGVTIEEGASVTDSVIMPGTHIGKNTQVYRSIIAENCRIGEGCHIGDPEQPDGGITVIGEHTQVPQSVRVKPGDMLSKHDFELQAEGGERA